MIILNYALHTRIFRAYKQMSHRVGELQWPPEDGENVTNRTVNAPLKTGQNTEIGNAAVRAASGERAARARLPITVIDRQSLGEALAIVGGREPLDLRPEGRAALASGPYPAWARSPAGTRPLAYISTASSSRARVRFSSSGRIPERKGSSVSLTFGKRSAACSRM